jgi:hypothetical protein
MEKVCGGISQTLNAPSSYKLTVDVGSVGSVGIYACETQADFVNLIPALLLEAK